MKVLIVDDEEDVRLVVQLSLGRIGGMTVREARSGEEAIRLAAAEQPDFILLDMMMPGMDGAATFLALQSSPETAGIPVVFLTAKALLWEAERLKALGAKGVVLKPFNPISLAADVRAILGV